jgi:hypothetical protein
MYLSSLSQLNSTQYGSNASTTDASGIQQMLAALAQVIQQLQTQSGTSSSSDASSALSGLSSSLSQLQSDAANGAISQSDVQNFLQQLQQVAAQVSSGTSGSSSTPQYSMQDGFDSGSTLSQGGGVLGRRAVMATVAGALGVDPSTLRSDLQSGMSITDVAQQQGVSMDTVKSAIESTLSQQNPQLSSSALSAIADRIIQGPPSGQQQGDPALLAQLQRVIGG